MCLLEDSHFDIYFDLCLVENYFFPINILGETVSQSVSQSVEQIDD
jgi:hypothetical protein